jgi:hypothetical protein
MAHATRSRRADLALLAPSREPEDPFGKVEKCAGEHKPPAAETYRSLYRRQKGRLVSVVETVVNLTAARNEKKKPNDFLVGVAGFEPATPASRTQCSTGLSHTPTRRRLIALAFAHRKKPN